MWLEWDLNLSYKSLLLSLSLFVSLCLSLFLIPKGRIGQLYITGIKRICARSKSREMERTEEGTEQDASFVRKKLEDVLKIKKE